MKLKEKEAEWRMLSEEVIMGMQEWREQHPQANLREIERVLDEQLARLRARMLQDTALASRAANWRGEANGEKCPECGDKLAARGEHKRQLQTHGGQEVILKREYGECSRCGLSFFPLDEE
jgi:DNA repair exonuclease SbcCD ATPase subunit